MSDVKLSDSALANQARGLDPVHSEAGSRAEMRWTGRLVVFLRLMAAVSMLKGLYHWAQVCGIWVAPDDVFEAHSVAWQAATIFFAVLDLVAAVGLWLAAAWGAVIWLTSVASMITVDVFFPQVFGGGFSIDMIGAALLTIYLWLALKSAREQPV
ncbi:MAG: DUF6163 family protein [Pseudolabrys sp.]